MQQLLLGMEAETTLNREEQQCCEWSGDTLTTSFLPARAIPCQNSVPIRYCSYSIVSRFPLMSSAYLQSGSIHALLPPSVADLAAGLITEALAIQDLCAHRTVSENAAAGDRLLLLGPNALTQRAGPPVQWGRYAAEVAAAAATARDSGGREQLGGCEAAIETTTAAMAVAVTGELVCCGLADGSIQVSFRV